MNPTTATHNPPQRCPRCDGLLITNYDSLVCLACSYEPPSGPTVEEAHDLYVREFGRSPIGDMRKKKVRRTHRS